MGYAPAWYCSDYKRFPTFSVWSQTTYFRSQLGLEQKENPVWVWGLFLCLFIYLNGTNNSGKGKKLYDYLLITLLTDIIKIHWFLEGANSLVGMGEVAVKPQPQVVCHQLRSVWRGITALPLFVTASEDAASLLLGTAFLLKYGSAYNMLDVSETFSHTKWKCEFGIRADCTDCQNEEQNHFCGNTFSFPPCPVSNL